MYSEVDPASTPSDTAEMVVCYTRGCRIICLDLDQNQGPASNLKRRSQEWSLLND
jgi:hypothetical protein